MGSFRSARITEARAVLRALRGASVAALVVLASAETAWGWVAQIAGQVGINDAARQIARDPAGDVIAVAGSTTEKYDGSSGALRWSVTAPDEPVGDRSLTTDGRGDVVVVIAPSAGQSMVVVKHAGGDGRKLWRVADTSGLLDPLPPLVDRQGDVIVVGRIGTQLAAVKLNGATGARRWLSRLPAFAPHVASAAAIGALGDVAVTGYLDDSLGSPSIVTKIAGSDGHRLWFTFLDARSRLPGVGFDAAGDVLVAGGRQIAINQGSACLVAKLDGASGAVRWRDFSVPGAPAVATVDAQGGIVLAGADGDLYTSVSTLVARWNGDGTLSWQQHVPYQAPGEYVTRLAIASGVVVVAGQLWTRDPSFGFFVLAVAAGNGTDLWRVQHIGDGAIEGFRDGETTGLLASESDGSIVLSASLADEGSGYDARLAKLAVADGSERWRVDDRGTTSQVDDYAKSVVVDPGGDVVAGGVLGSPASGLRGAAVKLSATDGHVLWRTTVDRLHGQSYATVDPAGDVFVTGAVNTGPPTPTDPPFPAEPAPLALTIVKLAGDDGHEVWRYRHAGGDGQALFGASAVDRQGDVVAAAWLGFLSGAQVVKIDGERGVALWTTTLAPRKSALRPAPVVVDATGDAIAGVNILSIGNAGNPIVAKLAGASGAVRWSVPVPVGATIAALATAPGGDVLVATDEAGDPGHRVVRRLAGASGAVLWATDLGAGRSKAIAVAASGAVLVAGSRVQATGPQWSIVELDGATGAVRWEHGAATLGIGNAVTSTAAGDVFVAGSVVSGGAVRFTVRALRGTDGALRWSQSFITGRGPSAAHAVALDAGGHVVAAGALAGDANGLDFGVVSIDPAQIPPACRLPRGCAGGTPNPRPIGGIVVPRR